MTGIHEPLILHLVEWIGMRPRPYADVMDAWRTSCPRLTIWEDTVDAGFVAHEYREVSALLSPCSMWASRSRLVLDGVFCVSEAQFSPIFSLPAFILAVKPCQTAVCSGVSFSDAST